MFLEQVTAKLSLSLSKYAAQADGAQTPVCMCLGDVCDLATSLESLSLPRQISRAENLWRKRQFNQEIPNEKPSSLLRGGCHCCVRCAINGSVLVVRRNSRLQPTRCQFLHSSGNLLGTHDELACLQLTSNECPSLQCSNDEQRSSHEQRSNHELPDR